MLPAEDRDTGYRITPALVRGLARNPKLLGMRQWGDSEPIINNHGPVVSKDLFLQAFELVATCGKPKGRAINNEPLEWAGLIWCCNHQAPVLVSSYASGGEYRCQHDYLAGRGPHCLNIEHRFFDKPLTTEVHAGLNREPL
jgi:hypothetical protein